MTTSWNNPQQIERYLQGTLSKPDTILFKALLLLDADLRLKVNLQKKTYDLVQLYGRQNLKTKLENIHRTLFNDPAKREYQQELKNIFITK